MCCKQFITHIILIAAEALWHLGSLFYHSTHYSQRGWFTNILWCDIPQNRAPQTGPHHIWSICTLCLFFGLWQAHRQQQRIWVDDFAGHCLLWRLLSCKTFFVPTLGLTANLWVGRSWLFTASSTKFLTRRSLKSLSVYLVLHEDNSNQLLSIVRPRGWKNNSMVHLFLDWLDQQKYEYLCSFLEAVPRLVISHLVQPVVRLLLRSAAATSVVVPLLILLLPPLPLFLLPLLSVLPFILSLHLPLFLLPLPLNSVQHCYPQHPIPSRCQQPQFHWWRPL